MARGQEDINILQERLEYPRKNFLRHDDLADIFSLISIAKNNGQGFFVLQNLGEKKASAVVEAMAAFESLPMKRFDLREGQTLEEMLDTDLGEALAQPFVITIYSDGLHDDDFSHLARVLNDGGQRVFVHQGKEYPIHEDTLVFLQSNNLNSENHPGYQDHSLVIGEAWLKIKRKEQGKVQFSPFQKVADYQKAGQNLFFSQDGSSLAQEVAAERNLPYLELDMSDKDRFQEKLGRDFTDLFRKPSVFYIKDESGEDEDLIDLIENFQERQFDKKDQPIHQECCLFLDGNIKQRKSDSYKAFVSLS